MAEHVPIQFIATICSFPEELWMRGHRWRHLSPQQDPTVRLGSGRLLGSEQTKTSASTREVHSSACKYMQHNSNSTTSIHHSMQAFSIRRNFLRQLDPSSKYTRIKCQRHLYEIRDFITD